MFNWLKKRCRRKSAPGVVPESKRMKPNCSMEYDAPAIENPYFTLETEPEYYIYESDSHIYEDVNYNAIRDMSVAITSLTSKIINDYDEDSIWCKREICPLCRKEQYCNCVTSDFDSDSGSAYNLLDVPTSTPQPFLRLQNNRRSLQCHKLVRNSSHKFQDLPKRRRPANRAMSDIQQRPLPAIPIRGYHIDEFSSDDDSSGFYETMNSESDLYEEIPAQASPVLKCTTV